MNILQTTLKIIIVAVIIKPEMLNFIQITLELENV